jgi:hypothetical protein
LHQIECCYFPCHICFASCLNSSTSETNGLEERRRASSKMGQMGPMLETKENIQYPTLNNQCQRKEKERKEWDRRDLCWKQKRTSNIQHSITNVKGKKRIGQMVRTGPIRGKVTRSIFTQCSKNQLRAASFYRVICLLIPHCWIESLHLPHRRDAGG